ncbi:hypothetical protein D3C86_1415870 [compost metagenome]
MMKPGPAISAWATIAVARGSACTAATIFWASSRGLLLSALATCMAILHARSPWAATLGRSKVTAGRAASAGASARTASVNAAARLEV